MKKKLLSILLVLSLMLALVPAAFAAGVLVVFLIRNLSVDYSWSIAIIALSLIHISEPTRRS